MVRYRSAQRSLVSAAGKMVFKHFVFLQPSHERTGSIPFAKHVLPLIHYNPLPPSAGLQQPAAALPRRVDLQPGALPAGQRRRQGLLRTCHTLPAALPPPARWRPRRRCDSPPADMHTHAILHGACRGGPMVAPREKVTMTSFIKDTRRTLRRVRTGDPARYLEH